MGLALLVIVIVFILFFVCMVAIKYEEEAEEKRVEEYAECLKNGWTEYDLIDHLCLVKEHSYKTAKRTALKAILLSKSEETTLEEVNDATIDELVEKYGGNDGD